MHLRVCRNPVDRILSAYEFMVEVASRQVLKPRPERRVRRLFRQRKHARRKHVQQTALVIPNSTADRAQVDCTHSTAIDFCFLNMLSTSLP